MEPELAADPVVQRVLEVVHGVLSSVPDGAYEARSEVVTDKWGASLVLTVEPVRAGAAQMAFRLDADAKLVYVETGADTRWELPTTATWGPQGKPYDDEVRSIVDAVVAGRFRELLWASQGLVARSEGTIWLLDGTPITSQSHHGAYDRDSLGEPAPEVRTYASYAETLSET